MTGISVGDRRAGSIKLRGAPSVDQKVQLTRRELFTHIGLICSASEVGMVKCPFPTKHPTAAIVKLMLLLLLHEWSPSRVPKPRVVDLVVTAVS